MPLGVLSAGLVGAIIWVSTPWPAAMVIRGLFELDAKRTVTEMEAFAPTADSLQSQLDVPYGDDGADTTFDLYSPAGTSEALPTVVWIHGGAWISGGKQNVDPYVQILAAEGFTTVALNYTVAPEATYPTALTQLNDALAHLITNAAAYNIDPSRIILAGDSAGAQLASQLATLATNPEYAELVGLSPALAADQLAGMVLNCGIYDVSGIPSAPGLGGYGFRVALWAYQGDKDWATTPAGQEMSTLDYVTADFPQTWISGGQCRPAYGQPVTAVRGQAAGPRRPRHDSLLPGEPRAGAAARVPVQARGGGCAERAHLDHRLPEVGHGSRVSEASSGWWRRFPSAAETRSAPREAAIVIDAAAPKAKLAGMVADAAR